MKFNRVLVFGSESDHPRLESVNVIIRSSCLLERPQMTRISMTLKFFSASLIYWCEGNGNDFRSHDTHIRFINEKRIQQGVSSSLCSIECREIDRMIVHAKLEANLSRISFDSF